MENAPYKYLFIIIIIMEDEEALLRTFCDVLYKVTMTETSKRSTLHMVKQTCG